MLGDLGSVTVAQVAPIIPYVLLILVLIVTGQFRRQPALAADRPRTLPAPFPQPSVSGRPVTGARPDAETDPTRQRS